MVERGRFIYGTAGWSYKDWVGPFYEGGTPASEFLAFYAKHFPGVEIDSTFYGIPAVATTEKWARTVPDGFIFSPKMVGTVTHERFLRNCDPELEEYLDALAPLGDKLGPIVLQFPYYRCASGVDLDRFLGRLLPFLDRLPAGYSFAVEVRNKPFLKPLLLDALRQRNVALVLVDHTWMPDPDDFGEIEGVLTADFVPVRLIGDRHGIEKITKTWEKVVVDRRWRLRQWAEVIEKALTSGMDVNAFVNNHYAGHGPATTRELAGFVER